MILLSLLIALLWVLVSAILFISTFIFYLAIINLRNAHRSGLMKNVHFSVYWTGYSILFVGLLLDTLLNWIFLTVTYFELPRECLATDRVVRHKTHGKGWRYNQSIWWCSNWLKPFDYGHCGDR